MSYLKINYVVTMKLRHKLQKTEYKNAESERGKTKKGYVLRNFSGEKRLLFISPSKSNENRNQVDISKELSKFYRCLI